MYHHADVQRVLANAVEWAAPTPGAREARRAQERARRRRLVRVTAARFATVTGTDPLRGVVVGAGQLGPYWARELLEHADVELVGWVDIDAERARRGRRRPGARRRAHRRRARATCSTRSGPTSWSTSPRRTPTTR